jgi:tetratricopeptide (TPR) repeat protein
MKYLPIITSLLVLVMLSGCGKQEEKTQANSDRHLRSAASYLEQGQLRAAMLEAKNSIQLLPNDFSGYKTLAQIYNTMGAFNFSQELLENKVSAHPELSTLLAEAYVGSHKYRSALRIIEQYPAQTAEEQTTQSKLCARAYIYTGDSAAFQRAIEEISSSANGEVDAGLLQARWQLANGMDEAAQLGLDQLIQKHPEHFDALILRGEIALYQNQLPIAEDHFTRALAMLPQTDIMTAKRAQALNQLTDTLIQQGRTSEAYIYQKILADNNPDNHSAQQRYNDALEFYQTGKFADAEAVLLQLHEEFPHNQTTGTLLALVQHQLGKDDTAAALFDQFIDPETATTSIIQAAALTKYRADQTDEALQLLKSASENQPRNAALLASYGMAQLEQDSTSSEAALALEKSLALDPSQQRLRIALANRYFALEDIPQAMAQLQKAYSEQPLDFVIQQTYFQRLFSQKMHEQAAVEVAAFTKRFPDNERRHFLAGWLHMENKDYDKALTTFRQGVADPSNNEKHLSHIGIAQILDLRKEAQPAAAAWQAALQDNPGVMVAYARYLKLMQELKREDNAISFLNSLEANEKFWQPSLVLARIHMLRGETAQATARIDTALARGGDNPQIKQLAAEIFYQQGVRLLSQQNANDAQISLSRALKLYPNNLNYVAALVQLELRNKNIPSAQQLLNEFTATDENQAARFYLQGLIHTSNNQPDTALTAYHQSWQTQPNESAAEAIFNRLPQDQRAEFLNQWIEKLPASPRPTLFKAMNAQTQGDTATAIQLYEKTLELAPNSAAALNNLAWIYYEQKNPQAQQLAQRAYQLAPKNAAILDTYGWILVETGDVAAGRKILRDAAEIDPDNEDIKRHLQEAQAR